ncbi:iron sulfur ABC transporter [Paucilactobacillus oligofermentans DSM 15707 = LMG 22743]|uniref:Iron sulfur ABC transporter n=1 Tax=Paucilactobacillus oligofermentans DSM 15707 = LMG 22743 TaxID=1423778 RepID=A0A0R1RE60_9LACO|nr:Fe-S cluster assembly protein SufD [Paucilactobacillus oligofermentans]KRL55344.1 iron sulfur ABC transporter [Paucilactobacillus oligofermentans DSM 15707 = LMG 22743]CUS25665.1 FeS cluster assembly protein 2 SufD2 [Paucilactobacillus oligofermentans DSM 15707 = LMG 22743]
MAIRSKLLQLSDAVVKNSQFENEPNWLTVIRYNAATLVPDLKLPTIDKVDYQRWPLFEFNETQNESKEIPIEIQAELSNYQFASLGIQTIKSEITDDMQSQGVIVTDFKTALRDHEELVHDYLAKAVKADEDQLTAINLALVSSGAVVYVPKNVHLSEPIQLLQVQDSRAKQNFVNRTLIIAEENCSFQVLQRTFTVGDQANPAHVTVEVMAKAGSHVRFSALDSMGEKTHSYFNRRGILARDSQVDWTLGVLNQGNTIADFDSDLNENGAHAEVKSVAISTGKQMQGINTRVTNRGKYSEGNILQRGVILDQATLVFNGIGKIIHGAHGAKAQQENRILMLSDQARGDANPILLIDENDVIAGHAASVGRINQQQLYYLMSRGLPKKVAQRLVIRGFLGVILREIPSETVRQQMVEMIERKLIDGQRTE